MTATAAGPPDAVAERLLKSSASHSYDPEVDIDWEAPIDPTLWGMQPERMSLYGTQLWEGLTEEQRIELSKHEVASHRERRALVRAAADADDAARPVRRRPAPARTCTTP